MPANRFQILKFKNLTFENYVEGAIKLCGRSFNVVYTPMAHPSTQLTDSVILTLHKIAHQMFTCDETLSQLTFVSITPQTPLWVAPIEWGGWIRQDNAGVCACASDGPSPVLWQRGQFASINLPYSSPVYR